MRAAKIAAALLTLATPAAAQWAVPRAAPTGDATLETLYAARDWHALGTALTANLDLAYALHSRAWLKAKLEAGGPFAIAALYAGNLWWIGNAQNQTGALDSGAHPAGALDSGAHAAGALDDRITAAAITLYAFELLAIDGAICADRTAPSHHASQIFKSRAATMDYLRAQPAATRQRAIDLALALEQKTANLRQPDPSICRGGKAEIQAGLAGGGAQHAIPGAPATTHAIQAPPGWAPTLLPPEIIQAAQAQNRSAMPTTLRNLVELQHP